MSLCVVLWSMFVWGMGCHLSNKWTQSALSKVWYLLLNIMDIYYVSVIFSKCQWHIRITYPWYIYLFSAISGYAPRRNVNQRCYFTCDCICDIGYVDIDYAYTWSPTCMRAEPEPPYTTLIQHTQVLVSSWLLLYSLLPASLHVCQLCNYCL